MTLRMDSVFSCSAPRISLGETLTVYGLLRAIFTFVTASALWILTWGLLNLLHSLWSTPFRSYLDLLNIGALAWIVGYTSWSILRSVGITYSSSAKSAGRITTASRR